MNNLNTEQNISQENKVHIDSNLVTIKKYLEKNGLDSTWVEKSSYMKDHFSKGNSPFEYLSFYFDEGKNELESSIKDVRGPVGEATPPTKIKFFEYDNVIAMESSHQRSFKIPLSADQFLFDDSTKNPEEQHFIRNVLYFDKGDGTFLAEEIEDQPENALPQNAIKSYNLNEEEIISKMRKAPDKYTILNNVIQLKHAQDENNILKRDNDSLRNMLTKSLKLAERVKNSCLGYLFFRKDVNNVLGVENKTSKRLQDGQEH